LEAEPASCFAALERSALEFRRLIDRPMRNGCGVVSRVEIIRSNIPYSSGFEAPCALVAAIFWYEQRIQLLASQYLDQRVTRIEHFGTYACRNIYGRLADRRSAHATARAIDISGFVLENGMLVSVRDDWGRESPENDFLHAARDEACRFFGLVLSPDYNTAHVNHLHLELRGSRLCR
jgi:hypothetical protein